MTVSVKGNELRDLPWRLSEHNTVPESFLFGGRLLCQHQCEAIPVQALTFFLALLTFRLTFLRMRDISKIINVQRKDKAFMA